MQSNAVDNEAGFSSRGHSEAIDESGRCLFDALESSIEEQLLKSRYKGLGYTADHIRDDHATWSILGSDRGHLQKQADLEMRADIKENQDIQGLLKTTIDHAKEHMRTMSEHEIDRLKLKDVVSWNVSERSDGNLDIVTQCLAPNARHNSAGSETCDTGSERKRSRIVPKPTVRSDNLKLVLQATDEKALPYIAKGLAGHSVSVLRFIPSFAAAQWDDEKGVSGVATSSKASARPIMTPSQRESKAKDLAPWKSIEWDIYRERVRPVYTKKLLPSLSSIHDQRVKDGKVWQGLFGSLRSKPCLDSVTGSGSKPNFNPIDAVRFELSTSDNLLKDSDVPTTITLRELLDEKSDDSPDDWELL